MWHHSPIHRATVELFRRYVKLICKIKLHSNYLIVNVWKIFIAYIEHLILKQKFNQTIIEKNLTLKGPSRDPMIKTIFPSREPSPNSKRKPSSKRVWSCLNFYCIIQQNAFVWCARIRRNECDDSRYMKRDIPFNLRVLYYLSPILI